MYQDFLAVLMMPLALLISILNISLGCCSMLLMSACRKEGQKIKSHKLQSSLNCFVLHFTALMTSISSHSKPRTRSCTRRFKCFVLEHSALKTKHLRRLV